MLTKAKKTKDVPPPDLDLFTEKVIAHWSELPTVVTGLSTGCDTLDNNLHEELKSVVGEFTSLEMVKVLQDYIKEHDRLISKVASRMVHEKVNRVEALRATPSWARTLERRRGTLAAAVAAAVAELHERTCSRNLFPGEPGGGAGGGAGGGPGAGGAACICYFARDCWRLRGDVRALADKYCLTEADARKMMAGARALCVRKTRMLHAAGDRALRVPPAHRPAARDWRQADELVAAGLENYLLISNEKAVEALSVLVSLVDELKVDVHPHAWVELCRRYGELGLECSAIVLQRRWLRLQEMTHFAFQRYAAAAREPLHPLFIRVATLFPHVVHTRPPTWLAWVQAGNLQRFQDDDYESDMDLQGDASDVSDDQAASGDRAAGAIECTPDIHTPVDNNLLLTAPPGDEVESIRVLESLDPNTVKATIVFDSDDDDDDVYNENEDKENPEVVAGEANEANVESAKENSPSECSDKVEADEINEDALKDSIFLVASSTSSENEDKDDQVSETNNTKPASQANTTILEDTNQTTMSAELQSTSNDNAIKDDTKTNICIDKPENLSHEFELSDSEDFHLRLSTDSEPDDETCDIKVHDIDGKAVESKHGMGNNTENNNAKTNNKDGNIKNEKYANKIYSATDLRKNPDFNMQLINENVLKQNKLLLFSCQPVTVDLVRIDHATSPKTKETQNFTSSVCQANSLNTKRYITRSLRQPQYSNNNEEPNIIRKSKRIRRSSCKPVYNESVTSPDSSPEKKINKAVANETDKKTVKPCGLENDIQKSPKRKHSKTETDDEMTKKRREDFDSGSKSRRQSEDDSNKSGQNPEQSSSQESSRSDSDEIETHGSSESSGTSVEVTDPAEGNSQQATTPAAMVAHGGVSSSSATGCRKTVVLSDIDSVRRTYRTLQTALVAPMTTQAGSSQDNAGAARAQAGSPDDDTIHVFPAADDGLGPIYDTPLESMRTDAEVMQLIDEIQRASGPSPPRPAPCPAHRHAPRPAHRPAHRHAHRPAHSDDHEQRRTQRALRRIAEQIVKKLQMTRVRIEVIAKKPCKKPSKKPSPPPPPPLPAVNDLAEWIRQKNINNQYFYISPPTNRQATVTSKLLAVPVDSFPQPSTSTQNLPSTSIQNLPSTSAQNLPSTSTQNLPSTSTVTSALPAFPVATASQPSTSTQNLPSTSTVTSAVPAFPVATASQPSTSTQNLPSTSTSNPQSPQLQQPQAIDQNNSTVESRNKPHETIRLSPLQKFPHFVSFGNAKLADNRSLLKPQTQIDTPTVIRRLYPLKTKPLNCKPVPIKIICKKSAIEPNDAEPDAEENTSTRLHINNQSYGLCKLIHITKDGDQYRQVNRIVRKVQGHSDGQSAIKYRDIAPKPFTQSKLIVLDATTINDKCQKQSNSDNGVIVNTSNSNNESSQNMPKKVDDDKPIVISDSDDDDDSMNPQPKFCIKEQPTADTSDFNIDTNNDTSDVTIDTNNATSDVNIDTNNATSDVNIDTNNATSDVNIDTKNDTPVEKSVVPSALHAYKSITQVNIPNQNRDKILITNTGNRLIVRNEAGAYHFDNSQTRLMNESLSNIMISDVRSQNMNLGTVGHSHTVEPSQASLRSVSASTVQAPQLPMYASVVGQTNTNVAYVQQTGNADIATLTPNFINVSPNMSLLGNTQAPGQLNINVPIRVSNAGLQHGHNVFTIPHLQNSFVNNATNQIVGNIPFGSLDPSMLAGNLQQSRIPGACGYPILFVPELTKKQD